MLLAFKAPEHGCHGAIFVQRIRLYLIRDSGEVRVFTLTEAHQYNAYLIPLEPSFAHAAVCGIAPGRDLVVVFVQVAIHCSLVCAVCCVFN